MSSRFWIRTVGSQSDIAHIVVPRALDSDTAYHLLAEIQTLITDGIVKYIVNLEEVEYVSSTGIEVLYRLQLDPSGQYGTVLVTNIPEKISQLFDKVGVMTVLDVAESFERAVERLSA